MAKGELQGHEAAQGNAYYGCALDSQGAQGSRRVVSKIHDGIGFFKRVAVADVAVIERDGAIGAAKIVKLVVPAVAFGSQAGKQ